MDASPSRTPEAVSAQGQTGPSTSRWLAPSTFAVASTLLVVDGLLTGSGLRVVLGITGVAIAAIALLLSAKARR